MAIVRLYPGRPAFVGKVCISTHDTWHLARRAAIRRRLLQTPRANKRRMREATITLQTFDARERAWYAPYGLTPPVLALASWDRYRAPPDGGMVAPARPPAPQKPLSGFWNRPRPRGSLDAGGRRPVAPPRGGA